MIITIFITLKDTIKFVSIHIIKFVTRILSKYNIHILSNTISTSPNYPNIVNLKLNKLYMLIPTDKYQEQDMKLV